MEKSNFCPKIQFWQNPNIFTSFSPNFFWQFFSWNQSCQQLKSQKPQHFHEFFTQKVDNFHGKSKLNFWTKNEDFEQCVNQSPRNKKYLMKKIDLLMKNMKFQCFLLLSQKLSNLWTRYSAVKNKSCFLIKVVRKVK